jgi:hypothetical protein
MATKKPTTKKLRKTTKSAIRRAMPTKTVATARRPSPPAAPAMPITGATAPLPSVSDTLPATLTPTPANPPRLSRARLLTPAARRGSELVRYLRIHAKHPYGKRGEGAVVELAREVAHLARVQLGEVAQ